MECSSDWFGIQLDWLRVTIGSISIMSTSAARMGGGEDGNGGSFGGVDGGDCTYGDDGGNGGGVGGMCGGEDASMVADPASMVTPNCFTFLTI